MKKFILTAVLTMAMSVNIFAGNNNIKLNNEYINLETPVRIEEGRSYVPLREIGEKILCAEVMWDGTTKSAVLTKDNNKITVTLGSNNIIVNDKEVALDYPAFAEDGKSFVPVRAIAEGFGYNVGYENGTITISDNVVSENNLVQFSPLKEGETLAKICTNYGDITVRFFPEYAPKAVENFIGLSKNGYYDGVTFHRVIDGFVIQGGDPTATGIGGESIWGTDFENEVCVELRNFRGALCMANAGPDTNSSQFYIVQNNKLNEDMEYNVRETIEAQKDSDELSLYPNNVLEKYLEIGGEPSLDFSYTVFGQVTEGMEVVDKIAAVETDDSDKPLNDIIIKKVEILN